MPSETDICNVALRHIGGSRITSLTDGTKNANVASDLYAKTRDQLLRKHFWSFAMVRVKLARLTEVPVFEFEYAYALPADWIRTRSAWDNDAGRGALMYKNEQLSGQRVIVTDAEDVWLRYVRRETDPNLMVEDFVRALEASLARDFAVPIANSVNLQQIFEREAARAVAEARSTGAIEQFPDVRPRGNWADSRGWRRYSDRRYGSGP